MEWWLRLESPSLCGRSRALAGPDVTLSTVVTRERCSWTPQFRPQTATSAPHYGARAMLPTSTDTSAWAWVNNSDPHPRVTQPLTHGRDELRAELSRPTGHNPGVANSAGHRLP